MISRSILVFMALWVVAVTAQTSIQLMPVTTNADEVKCLEALRENLVHVNVQYRGPGAILTNNYFSASGVFVSDSGLVLTSSHTLDSIRAMIGKRFVVLIDRLKGIKRETQVEVISEDSLTDFLCLRYKGPIQSKVKCANLCYGAVDSGMTCLLRAYYWNRDKNKLVDFSARGKVVKLHKQYQLDNRGKADLYELRFNTSSEAIPSLKGLSGAPIAICMANAEPGVFAIVTLYLTVEQAPINPLDPGFSLFAVSTVQHANKLELIGITSN